MSASKSGVEPSIVVDVAAGLVLKSGRILLAQRREGAHLGGFWEFPGGKRESDESWEACLARELKEELGVEVKVGGLYSSVTHAYPERTVYLRFYLCQLVSGEPCPIGCAALAWVTPETVRSYRFPAADDEIIDRLLCDEAIWKNS